ncbi:hypothetical protein BGZ63DRAFT_62930 [Mariannaea sp. PMI_226]|nr:hypothetical protein BGZ63DRAFT_62930 [Mariannaea sp. PMI_226]
MSTTATTTTSKKTIAYFGATGGCGLNSLKLAVADGHTCIALCRTPAKLEALFPAKPSNLIVKQGNAHNADHVAACLAHPHDPTRLVDIINFSIGGQFDPMHLTIDDPDVCKNGIVALLQAIASVRANTGRQGQPLICAISTTGISKHGRDVPLGFAPLYHMGLKIPHADKRAMEDHLIVSGERYTIVRPSFLVEDKPGRKIRVGVEDPRHGFESKAVGYFISREAVGRWMYENLIEDATPRYVGKVACITW